MFTVPPSIQPIDNEMVIEGGSVTLTCSASGFPAPTVYWVKASSGDRFNRMELVFTNINRSEAGEYTCVASNPCNTSTELAEVDVRCKLTQTMLHFFPSGKWRRGSLVVRFSGSRCEGRGSRAIHRQEIALLVVLLCNSPHSFFSITY